MLTQANVLIVEDDQDTAEHLRLRLEALGHRVVGVATSGDQALATVMERSPDIVFMDIALDGVMDGIETARRIQEAGDMPVVFITSHVNDGILERLGDMENCNYFMKPPEEGELLAAIQTALAKIQRETARHDRVERELQSLADGNVRMVMFMDVIMRLRLSERELIEKGDIDNFYRSVIEDLAALTGSRYAAIGLLDDGGRVGHLITYGVSDEVRAQIKAPLQGKGLLAKVFETDTPLRVDDISSNPIFEGFPPGHPQMKSLMGMQIRVGSVPRGAIYLADKRGGEPYTESDELLLSLCASEVSHMLDRHELLSEMRRQQAALNDERHAQKKLIRQLREAQEKLLQSEKLASIGQLAAGVAHEINNPVGYISSNIGSLKQYLEDIFRLIDTYEACEETIPESGHGVERVRKLKNEIELDYLRHDMRDLIAECQEGVSRVKRIVQDLKDFSHVDEGEWEWADIHRGLDSTLNIVHNEIKYKAEVIKEYGALPEVECQPSQLNQVFMNLLVNAAHAIEEQGTIWIRSGTDGPDWVWVEIVDDGKGISPENLTRIFDPFFTTKPVGKGTGLGLSLSYGIVQKHNGRIDVQSELGKGTSFRVTLPVKREGSKA